MCLMGWLGACGLLILIGVWDYIILYHIILSSYAATASSVYVYVVLGWVCWMLESSINIDDNYLYTIHMDTFLFRPPNAVP